MSRDNLPTIPEGKSLASSDLTILWMEIGDHAVYQIGHHIGPDTYIYLRGAKTVMSQSDYAAGLRLEVVFTRIARSSSLSAERRATKKLESEVDDLLGEPRPQHISTIPVPPTATGITRRLHDFVEITTILAHRNIKRLRVRSWVSLPPFSGEQWVLELGFPNLPNQPRILRPSDSDIIPLSLKKTP